MTAPRYGSDLTAEEYRRVRNGESLESVLRGRETGRDAPKSPRPAVDGPPSRSRSPAVPVVIDGFRFDSKVEGRRYEWLRDNPDVSHIDVHPIITYGKGKRYQADFVVWWFSDSRRGPFVEDVKGRKPDTAFFRLWRDFNESFHGPLDVVRERRDKSWETFTDPEEARRKW